MTCIATDGKTMAGDSRVTMGHLIVNDAAEKMFRLEDGTVVGCSGEIAVCTLVRDWFDKGADPACIPSFKETDASEKGGPFDALILRPDGSVEFMDHQFTPIPHAVPTAIGSGSEIALGAMLSGKSPVQAVRIASDKVTSVGGRITELTPGKADE